MEPTIINGSDVTVEEGCCGMDQILITQPDDDVVVLHNSDVAEFITAIRGHTHTVEDPGPEKWYAVLKNSNSRLLNRTDDPIIFSVYADAREYGRKMGGLERTYVPISVDEYERAFGR